MGCGLAEARSPRQPPPGFPVRAAPGRARGGGAGPAGRAAGVGAAPAAGRPPAPAPAGGVLGKVTVACGVGVAVAAATDAVGAAVELAAVAPQSLPVRLGPLF